MRIRIPVATWLALVVVPAAGVAQDKDELHKCDTPIGTLAGHEPQQEYMSIVQRHGLGSPAALFA